MIIAIDFDGTICQNKYPDIGEPMTLSIKSIRELHQAGHFLILWTCRQGEQLNEALKWCEENGLSFHAVNDHNPDNLKLFGGVGGNKVYADVYIDDRNLGGFLGWERAMELIKEAEDPKLEWTINERLQMQHMIGHAKISERTQIVYFCRKNVFRHEEYWSCLQILLSIEIDPSEICPSGIYEYTIDGLISDKDAIKACEADFKKLLQERQ